MIALCGVSLAAVSSTNEYPCPYADLKPTMDACEQACMTPDGLVEIYCYEYCIDEVCYHH